jgi:hypothetical protein
VDRVKRGQGKKKTGLKRDRRKRGQGQKGTGKKGDRKKEDTEK